MHGRCCCTGAVADKCAAASTSASFSGAVAHSLSQSVNGGAPHGPAGVLRKGDNIVNQSSGKRIKVSLRVSAAVVCSLLRGWSWLCTPSWRASLRLFLAACRWLQFAALTCLPCILEHCDYTTFLVLNRPAGPGRQENTHRI